MCIVRKTEDMEKAVKWLEKESVSGERSGEEKCLLRQCLTNLEKEPVIIDYEDSDIVLEWSVSWDDEKREGFPSVLYLREGADGKEKSGAIDMLPTLADKPLEYFEKIVLACLAVRSGCTK